MIPAAASYAELRSLMRQGDAILTADCGLIARLIRWRTRGCVNHVGAIVRAWGRVYVSQATVGKGVHLVEFSTFLEQRKGSRVLWLPGALNDLARLRFGCEMGRYLGLPYESQLNMLLTALQRDQAANKRWFCSELYAHVHRVVGMAASPFARRKPGLTWPEHVLEALGGLGVATRVLP